MKRKLHPDLKKYLDDELFSVCQRSPALILAMRDPLVLISRAAKACVGIKEEGGDNQGRLVSLFQFTIGGAHGEAWCVGFLQSLICYVEYRLGVRCNIFPTESVIEMWEKTPLQARVPRSEYPMTGDLMCWRYANTEKGHAELVYLNHYKVVETIGGNTSPSGIVDREGDGVFEKIRSKSGTSTMQVLGFLRPTFEAIVKPAA